MRPLWRVRHEQSQADHGENAERQVDVEYPSPGVEIGQVAAKCRADHRTHGDAHGEDRHRLGAAGERIDVQHRRLRQRGERGAEHALQQTKATSCSSDCAAPHSTEATVKPAMQMMNNRLRPKRTAIQPTGAVMMAAAIT